MENATAISGNQLKGVYFNNPDRWKSKDARTAYDPSTMRVLTVKDGKLVYATDNSLDYLPANQSYLKVPAGTAETLTVMTEEEYHTPEPILIMGDINRDGKISIADLAARKNHRRGSP